MTKLFFENAQQLYRYRALLWALVSRQLAVRYRGSALGFLWTLLNPLLLMAVYTLVFKFYIRFDAVEHYSVFVFCGLLPWIWLTSALTEGTQSVTSSGHLITKSLFPAQLLPMVAVVGTGINFLLSLPILLLFMWILAVPFHLTMLFLPVLVLLQGVLVAGMVLGLSALNVRFRDVQHLLSNALTFLFFLCPIVYPSSNVPQSFRFTMELNPFAVLTTSYHQVVLEGVLPSATALGVLGGTAVVALLIGGWIFERSRENFAELL